MRAGVYDHASACVLMGVGVAGCGCGLGVAACGCGLGVAACGCGMAVDGCRYSASRDVLNLVATYYCKENGV